MSSRKIRNRGEIAPALPHLIMTIRLLLRRSPSLALFSLALLLGACSAPEKHVGGDPGDRAYIRYWPRPEGSNQLRLAVKDLIDMKGVVTTAGSEFLAKKGPPARRDAKCLEIARARNVAIVGKTNVTELAVGVSGINEYFGTPRNPITTERTLIPGGSSSGSAVAVATGSADVAFGTDTAGSIRVPAACCGIVGLKTTFGLIPLDGVYPIAPTNLDTVGPMGKDVAHVAQGMDLLQRGFLTRYRGAAASLRAGRQITVGRLYVPGTDRKVDRAVDEALAAAGFRVVRLGEDFQKKWAQATSDGNTIAAACAWEYDQQFRQEPLVKGRTKAVFMLGGLQYKTTYPEALQRREAWVGAMAAMLRQVDFIALPTLKKLPPSVPIFGGTPAFEARVLGIQNTVAVNLAGNPAVAVPVPVRDRAVPLTSLQLVGRRFGEAELLAAAARVEAARP
jgi:amidase